MGGCTSVVVIIFNALLPCFMLPPVLTSGRESRSVVYCVAHLWALKLNYRSLKVEAVYTTVPLAGQLVALLL